MARVVWAAGVALCLVQRDVHSQNFAKECLAAFSCK
jgi:hypothetical protein